MRRLLPCALSALAVALSGTAAAHAQDHRHDTATGRVVHADAAKLANPVPADAASLVEGKQLYDKACASCHGDTGHGVGTLGSTLNPPPPDLTDAIWKHGSTDGELFTIIRDGARKTAMKGYGASFNTRELWSIVNYLRSIGPKPPPSH